MILQPGLDCGEIHGGFGVGVVTIQPFFYGFKWFHELFGILMVDHLSQLNFLKKKYIGGN